MTDDHLYVYNLRKIPCVDIINYDPKCDTGFGDFWHTTDDTMDVIDKNTLMAVGQTVLEVIYNENNFKKDNRYDNQRNARRSHRRIQ